MYTPAHFTAQDEAVVVDLVRQRGFGHLVCSAGAEIRSTPLPFLVDDELTIVAAHLARANPIWQLAPCPALFIVAVSDAYVSPSWYPSKAEHGKVVPTWNYEVVHLHGRLTLRDDKDWLLDQVTALTQHNEAARPKPWAVSDAPADFIAKQLKSIVGVELTVERVEAKRKLSQNRSSDDVAGVIDGLRSTAGGACPVADGVEQIAKSTRSD